jgi:MFS family permease
MPVCPRLSLRRHACARRGTKGRDRLDTTVGARRTELWRLFAVSFAADLQLYLIYTAAPFKALKLGAGAFELGLLAAAATGTYALVVNLAGRASDRVPRLMLARACCVAVIVACMGLTLADEVGRLILWMPLVGAGMSLFWPSVQASIADRSRLDDLEKQLGRFNLAWSLGKGSGFLFGGLLLAALGATSTFTVASCIVFAIFFILPWPRAAGPVDSLAVGDAAATAGADADAMARSPAGGNGNAASLAARLHDAEHGAIDPRAAVFRRIAWVANGTAFGLGATLTYHYPSLVAARGWSPRVFGTFLGLVYLTQTLAFAFLMRRPDTWRFRRLRLYVPQFLMLVAMLGLPLAGISRLLVSALCFGAGLGIAYCSSIYYSLLTHEERGRNAGVHESLMGLGAMLVPFVGGVLARSLGSAWMPYATAAAAVLLSLGLQEFLYRAGTSPRRAARTHGLSA